MEPVRIQLGCGNYDRTRALIDGTVRPEGVELDYVVVRPHDLFARVLIDGEFDAAEMSASNLATLIARGDRELIGIPVILSRVFRHGYIFVNVDAGIEQPQNLIGKRVGLAEYSMTAAVWMRGFLQHDYGVSPDRVHWIRGEMNEPGRIERLELQMPEGVRLDWAPKDRSLGEMLEAGEIDALMAPSLPLVVQRGSPRIKRLFPNYREVEQEYFARTGLVHIMHILALRRSVYERNPRVARDLYEAFLKAKDVCSSLLEETGAPKVSLTWFQSALDAERAVFGRDHWPYGVRGNRKSLEALVSYVYEQGLSDRVVALEELFAPETVET